MQKILVGLCLIFIGCSGNQNASSTNTSTLPSIGNVASPAPSAGPVTNDAFSVNAVMPNTEIAYFMNKSSAFGTNCSIDATVTGQNIVCYLDMNETDVYTQPFSLVYNVPQTMCKYFEFTPYWYYNHETGFGPTRYTISIDYSDTSRQILSSVNCNVDGVSYPGCANIPELQVVDAIAGSVKCIYDQSPASANCCFGNYTATLTSTINGAQPLTSTTSSNWNTAGGMNNCTGGQGHNNWALKTKVGYPATQITYIAGVGLNNVYTMVPPINGGNSGVNVEVANFYGDVSQSHSGYVSSRTTNRPYAVDPVDDRNGSLMLPGNDSYFFDCQDHNHETVNSVRVYVRAWNTYSDFLVYGTSGGVTYQPNVSGIEGSNCSGVGTYCDDFMKWDSHVGSPSRISRDYVGPYTSANRQSYFPEESY